MSKIFVEGGLSVYAGGVTGSLDFDVCSHFTETGELLFTNPKPYSSIEELVIAYRQKLEESYAEYYHLFTSNARSIHITRKGYFVSYYKYF